MFLNFAVVGAQQSWCIIVCDCYHLLTLSVSHTKWWHSARLDAEEHQGKNYLMPVIENASSECFSTVKCWLDSKMWHLIPEHPKGRH